MSGAVPPLTPTPSPYAQQRFYLFYICGVFCKLNLVHWPHSHSTEIPHILKGSTNCPYAHLLHSVDRPWIMHVYRITLDILSLHSPSSVQVAGAWPPAPKGQDLPAGFYTAFLRVPSISQTLFLLSNSTVTTYCKGRSIAQTTPCEGIFLVLLRRRKWKQVEANSCLLVLWRSNFTWTARHLNNPTPSRQNGMGSFPLSVLPEKCNRMDEVRGNGGDCITRS